MTAYILIALGVGLGFGGLMGFLLTDLRNDRDDADLAEIKADNAALGKQVVDLMHERDDFAEALDLAQRRVTKALDALYGGYDDDDEPAAAEDAA
mgnify:CR=1 FL=1